ncbi:MAG: hypothetical protein AAF799_05980 [Myxococcota bacterium]
MTPRESYDDCFVVEGVMLEDGITMEIGGTTEEGEFFNRRRALFDTSPPGYELVRFEPDASDPQAESQETLVASASRPTSQCQPEYVVR